MSARTDRVLALLRDRSICSLYDFYRTQHRNDRNAVPELRAMGYGIQSETRAWHCTSDPDEPAHTHHRLVLDPKRVPVQQRLIAV